MFNSGFVGFLGKECIHFRGSTQYMYGPASYSVQVPRNEIQLEVSPPHSSAISLSSVACAPPLDNDIPVGDFIFCNDYCDPSTLERLCETAFCCL